MPAGRLILALGCSLNAMRSRLFSIGFIGGLLLFVAANLYRYYRMNTEPVLIDAAISFGIPFKFYVSSGFGGGILWSHLIADVVIALCVSTILGWISAKLFSDATAA